MKKLSTILCILALLFGALGGVSPVKAAKTIGTKYTSVEQLSGKAFSIVNETAGKAIYHKGTPSPFTLGYDNYNTAFSVTNTGYKFIIEQVNDSSDPAANGKYLIRCVKEDGSVYDNNYFQTNSSDESFVYALNFGGSQRGLDGANTAVWDIEYNALAGGWSIKNVGKNGYLNDPTKGATNASPAYFTFCEVQEVQNLEPADQNVNITIGGETRKYQLYVPNTAQANCPLVISLHGANGQSTNYSPFGKDVADWAGCIVVYPQGKLTSFPIGFGGSATGWTATGENNFDVEFLKAVIEDVASKYQIDRKRIYCCGFSNGGMMTYAMANACSNEIAAFASISGYPINEFHLRHTGVRPVPFLHIHGKADDFVKYSLVPTIVDEMVARLGANPVPTKTTGSGYTKSVYAAADGSFPYVYYEIDGMGHEAYTANTEDGHSGKTMWNFFKQYTLDSPCDKTLKWAPRIDENGYNPAQHGWTKNSGTTLLKFGGAQYTTDNKNVYHSLQFNSGSYKLSFKSTGTAGKTVGVKIEKLTSPNSVVLNTTVNVGETVELPFTVTGGWGEYKLTMTRPSTGDAITITDLVVTQVESTTPVASKKELTPTGSTFVTQTYTKFSASAAPELAFDINPFEKGDWEKFVIELASPTTYADWLLCNRPTPYWNGGWWDEIDPGTTGNIELDLTNGSRDFGRLCLQAGDPTGYREIIVKDIYVSKESGATKSSILSSISGGTDVVVEEATAAGVKAFDMTGVDVSGYQKLVIAFTSPTVGQWVLNIDGTDETIPAGTQYYKVDVSGKTMLSKLALSVGNDELPRANNFDKLYLSNPLSISSDADWTTFAERVNGGETDLDAVLTADINAGSTMVGTEAKPYQGTFDGAGHTLTFAYDGASNLVAPFKEVNGASFVDLKTTGSITSTANLLGGIVGQVNGATTLTRCASDMSITTTVGTNGRIGGLVARNGQTGSSLTFNNCMYNGAISSSTNQAAGFVGWSPNATTISNCLVAASSITGGESNFTPNNITVPTGQYALYISQFGSSTQGTAVSDAQRYNGYVAYTLNQGIGAGALFFGQGYLNSYRVEAAPSLTSDGSKKVYKASNEALYANADGLLPDPALSGKLAWKMAMTWDPIYFISLPAASASSFNLYGSADSHILKVSAAEAATLVVPFDVAETKIPEGVKVYNLTFEGTDIKATEVNEIKANKPVLINAPEGEYRLESGINNDQTITFPSTLPTNGALTGVYCKDGIPFSYVPANAYVLQNGDNGLGFYQVEEDNSFKITSFRAYLTAPASGARSLRIVYADNESTSISEVSNKYEDGTTFNLNGQRVEKAAKGLYIKNGKKVVIK